MLGGLAGYGAGQLLARQIGHWIFNASIPWCNRFCYLLYWVWPWL